MKAKYLEKGSASVETVLLAPIVFTILGLLLAGANIAITDQAVTAASHSASRAASLSSNPSQAENIIKEKLIKDLSSNNRSCKHLEISIDPTGFNTQPGIPATVSAQITCTIPYANIIPVPGLPGTRTITVKTISPLDNYRER